MKINFELFKDFKVKYKFRSHKEGGRKKLPEQGVRFDFWYHHPDHYKPQVFMIWPAFEDEMGNLIEKGIVNEVGIARMLISNKNMLDYHESRLAIGVKGYFMEGLTQIADCEIIELGKSFLKN